MKHLLNAPNLCFCMIAHIIIQVLFITQSYFWLFHVHLWQSKLSIITVLCRYSLFNNTLRTYYEILSLTWHPEWKTSTQGTKLHTIWTRSSCQLCREPLTLEHSQANAEWTRVSQYDRDPCNLAPAPLWLLNTLRHTLALPGSLCQSLSLSFPPCHC